MTQVDKASSIMLLSQSQAAGPASFVPGSFLSHVSLCFELLVAPPPCGSSLSISPSCFGMHEIIYSTLNICDQLCKEKWQNKFPCKEITFH